MHIVPSGTKRLTYCHSQSSFEFSLLQVVHGRGALYMPGITTNYYLGSSLLHSGSCLRALFVSDKCARILSLSLLLSLVHAGSIMADIIIIVIKVRTERW